MLHLIDDHLRDLARRLADFILEGHRTVGLKVPELRILRTANHAQRGIDVFGQRGQHRREPAANLT